MLGSTRNIASTTRPNNQNVEGDTFSAGSTAGIDVCKAAEAFAASAIELFTTDVVTSAASIAKARCKCGTIPLAFK